MAWKSFQSVILILYWSLGISQLPRKCLEWMASTLCKKVERGQFLKLLAVCVSVGAVCNSSSNLLFIRLLNKLWCRTFQIWIIKYPQKSKMCLLIYFLPEFCRNGFAYLPKPGLNFCNQYLSLKFLNVENRWQKRVVLEQILVINLGFWIWNKEDYLICIASDVKGYLICCQKSIWNSYILSIESFPKKGVLKPDSWRTPVNYYSCQQVWVRSLPRTMIL